MLRNYITVALRNIRKHTFYSSLNIAGLAFGLTASFLIGLYVHDELTYDEFHKDSQNLYRVGLHIKTGGEEMIIGATCFPLASAMVSDIPGVEQAICLNPQKQVVIRYGDKAFTESNVLEVDSNFFEFFSFPLLEGNPKTVLKELHSAVLTKAAAGKYFGDESPIGKIIVVGNDKEAFTVTGVAEQAPANSHIQYDVLLSFKYDKKLWDIEPYTYYRKNPKTQQASIETGLREIVKKHVAPEIEAGFEIPFETFEKQGGIFSFFSYPLAESHLYHPEIRSDFSPGSELKYVYMLSAVGVFILLIACINFMNLSTARSVSRAREVGLRKTFGSARSKLVVQFLAESFLYVFTALCIAVAGVYVLLPAFNLLSGKTLFFSTMLSPVLIGAGVFIFVVVALVAGSYPAFYLTSFKPVAVLKGNVRSGMKSKGIRSSLVIIQFTISIALIISTMVVYQQLHYMQEKNIGLDKNNVLVLENTDRLGKHQQAFLNEISQQAGVVKASYLSTPFPEMNQGGIFHEPGKSRDLIFSTYQTDYNHLEVLRMEMVQGRFFSPEFPSDSSVCVLNETALKQLGWNDPLKEKLNLYDTPLRVIGVVKDFNYESLKSSVKPLIIHLGKRSNTLLIRYNPENYRQALAAIEEIWNRLAPGEPYAYAFLDQNFDKLFREEQRLGKVFTVMSGIAIVVACLGLLGLAAFTAEQRTKEIGIRKVLGATVASINSLLAKEFMVLVGISFGLASALAGYAMHRWLDSFAYRIAMSPLVFLLGGILAATLSWITVSYHFVKAARSNPTDALRCE